MDAAFVWRHNDKTYFFKDRRYWRYDDQLRQMDPGYPKDSALWKGLPPNLDDAMSWSDGEVTFDVPEVTSGVQAWMVSPSPLSPRLLLLL